MPVTNPRPVIVACLQQLHCYGDPNRIQRDTEALLMNITSLTPKIGSLIHNNGSESTLMMLSGTLPIIYGGNQYNIPVDLYIPEGYPNVPPVIYVRPTSNMMIKPGHRHVDSEGLVYLPYLHEWKPNTSNLLELCNRASSVFSGEPPCFVRPKQPAATVTPAPAPAQPRPAAVVTPQPAVTLTQHAYYPQAAKPVEPLNPREALINRVTHKLQEELHKFYIQTRTEIDAEFETQSKLQKSQEMITSEVTELRATRDRLQNALRIVSEKRQDLERWHTQSLETEAAEDIDSIISPVDIPSRQLIDAMAEYHAIEDTLYYMDRAVAASASPTVTIDVFLRETRRLSRQQFLAKCLANKIAQVCS